MEIDSEFQDLENQFINGITPKKNESILEWASKNRYLPPATTQEPGLYDVDIVPYYRGVHESLDKPGITVHIKPSQIGGTEVACNFIGHTISNGLGPMIVTLPKRTAARMYCKKRIDPMIEYSEDLSSKVVRDNSKGKYKDPDNTLFYKKYKGGTLELKPSNVAMELRMDPIGRVVMEELSDYVEDVEGQGPPDELIIGRTKTFKRTRIIYMVSTPGVAGKCKITEWFTKSSIGRYHVPCPHCGEFQDLKFQNLVYDLEKETAQYECEHCHTLIDEKYKMGMLKRGRWVHEFPDREIRGFHLNGLYAPPRLGNSWLDIARKWENIGNDVVLKKDFFNNELGEAYQEEIEVPDWEILYRRREDYSESKIPMEVLFLTMGVDVQKNYLSYSIEGFTRNRENYTIRFDETIQGDTNKPGVWNQLSKIIHETFLHESGVKLPIVAVGIDSGYRSNAVYKFVRTQNSQIVHAIDGSSDTSRIFKIGSPSRVDVIDHTGRRHSRGVLLYPIGGHCLKSEIYASLGLDQPIEGTFPVGYIHFSKDQGQEYFEQLCGEKMVMDTSKGKTRFKWEKLRKAQEALDCKAIALAMAEKYGLSTNSQEEWDDLEYPILKKLAEHNKSDISFQPKERPIRKIRKIRRNS